MTALRKLKGRLYRLEVLACLAAARLLIRFVPFRWWQWTLGPFTQESTGAPSSALSEQQVSHALATGRMVARVARRAPFQAVCLPQAMAARWLLARRGTPARVIIGSRRNPQDKTLLLHAWLMAGDHVITGAEERRQFIAFRSGPTTAQPTC